MAFVEKRDLFGQLMKANYVIEQKEITLTPFRGTTWVHLNDKKKDKSVSFNIYEFIKMGEVINNIINYHNQFFPNLSILMLLKCFYCV